MSFAGGLAGEGTLVVFVRFNRACREHFNLAGNRNLRLKKLYVLPA